MLRRIALAVAALALGFVPGCSSVYGTEPNVRVTDTRLDGLTFEGVKLLVDVELNNPTREAMAVESFNYGITLANEPQPAVTGPVPAPATVAAKSAVKETVPVTLRFTDLAMNVVSLKPGSVLPYTVAATAMTNPAGTGPGSGAAELEGEKTGELPVPALPLVEVVDVEWNDSGVFGASGVVTLAVTNTNTFPIDLKRLKWAVSLGGKSLVGGKVNPMTFAPGETEQVELPVSVSTFNVGRAMMGMASSGNASYEVSGDLRIRTPYGEIGSPFKRSGSTSVRDAP
ncbi:MAG: LEA type 2 family protein [Phycisphaerales bacterium]